MRVLSDDDVASVLSLESLLPVVADAFRAQGQGDVERPERPHYPVGEGIQNGPLGTALVMPAYVHGADCAATKLATVHEGNADRDLPTVQAQIALTDAATGRPAAYMAGTRVTNARTGCIGGLAARELADAPVTLALVGAGTQARWQARAVAAATDVERVRVHSPDTREACAADLRDQGLDAEAVPGAREAVAGADAVVTVTTATDPVFPADALADGALVVAVGAYTGGMQELPPAALERASRVYADVPEEVAATGDLLATDLDAADLVPFASVFEDGHERSGGVVVVESVGTAVLDAAAAEHLLEEARERDAGAEVGL